MKDKKIDFDEITSAMEDRNRYDLDYYLDTKTGKVIPLSSEVIRMIEENAPQDDLSGWTEDEVKIAKEILNSYSDRYIHIPEKPHYETYDLMVKFAEKVGDKILQEKLAIALDGKGAFGRFNNVLSGYPEYKKKWFSFKDEIMRSEIAEWLESIKNKHHRLFDERAKKGRFSSVPR